MIHCCSFRFLLFFFLVAWCFCVLVSVCMHIHVWTELCGWLLHFPCRKENSFTRVCLLCLNLWPLSLQACSPACELNKLHPTITCLGVWAVCMHACLLTFLYVSVCACLFHNLDHLPHWGENFLDAKWIRWITHTLSLIGESPLKMRGACLEPQPLPLHARRKATLQHSKFLINMIYHFKSQ